MLTILKITSYAVTAAFGIFGLLTEFKDKNKKVTASGKIALVGIVAGFLVSGVITVLEARSSRAVEETREQEIRRLQRPLAGDLHASFVLSVPADSVVASHFRPQLVSYFQNLISKKCSMTCPYRNFSRLRERKG